MNARFLLAIFAAAFVMGAAASSSAVELSGTVIDAYTELPLADVEIRVRESGDETRSGADGRFDLAVADGYPVYTLAVQHRRGGEVSTGIYVDATPERESTLRMFAAGGEPTTAMHWGAPLERRPDDGIAPEPVSLDDWLEAGGPNWLTVVPPLPASIRVGRRFASSCSGNPVQQIDDVPLEEYVQGVLVPEIGVFRNIAGGPESSAEVFKAFAIAARSYAVWFYYRNPDAEYHIDDTACNQRYEGLRNEFIADQVAATAGMIMVRASDHNTLDQYEYAASCGRHGSRPEYQDALVPDLTGVEACVGSWCGHNSCAAHETNPEFPDEGRCLVRGICQWGAAERSMRGDSYTDIIAHYQPNLDIVTLNEPAITELMGFVRVGDVVEGPGVEGVNVELDTGESTTTGADGFFRFVEPEEGLRTLAFSGAGIIAISREKDVFPGISNWASVAVELEGAGGDDSDAGDADVGGDSDGGGSDAGDAAEGADSEGPPDSANEEDSPTVDNGDTPDDDSDDGVADNGAAAAPGYGYVSDLGLGDTGCGCGSTALRGGDLLCWPFGMLGLAFVLLRRRS